MKSKVACFNCSILIRRQWKDFLKLPYIIYGILNLIYNKLKTAFKKNIPLNYGNCYRRPYKSDMNMGITIIYVNVLIELSLIVILNLFEILYWTKLRSNLFKGVFGT